jgi:hypothetical protein
MKTYWGMEVEGVVGSSADLDVVAKGENSIITPAAN